MHPVLIRAESIRATESPCVPRTGADYDALALERSQVQRSLTTELDALLLPLGYQRKGSDWSKNSVHGRSVLNFQKGQNGLACYFNAGVMTLLERASPIGSHSSGGSRYFRLAAFCPELPKNFVADALHYARLHDDAAFRNGVLTVIRARVIPWLEARHSHWFRSPAPEDMRRIRIFEDV